MKSLVRVAVGVAVVGAVLVLFTFIAVRQPSLARADDLLISRAQPSRLNTDVEWLTNHHLPRSADHPENLARVADYIAAEFTRAGARVQRQRFSARGHDYQNVIAEIGDAARRPALIIGAHYDVFAEKKPLPGADDNASGVAGLLELARILQATHARVDLVAYANEEPPFFGSDQMGSAVHAASSTGTPMISLEMIGYFTEHQPRTDSVLDYLVPATGDFVIVAGRWSDRELSRRVRTAFNASSKLVDAYSLTLPEALGIDASDQVSYWRRGFSAVMISDTAYVRNPSYHTARDTAWTLDYVRMASVVDGVANVALQPAM